MAFTSRASWFALVVSAVASEHLAHADEPAAARAKFATASDHERVEILACSLPTISAVDGIAHKLDIRVNGKRCASGPVAGTVVQVLVEPRLDGQSEVVVEATASDGVELATVRAIVDETRDDLTQRCAPERVPISVPGGQTVLEDRWRSRPGLLATGVILAVVGTVAGVGGGAIVTTRYQPCGSWDFLCFNDALPAIGGVLIAVGGALALVGVPLIVYGAQSRRVQVRVSGTGAMFEGTF